MSPETRDVWLDKIDEEAARQKARVKYIDDLVKDNETLLREVFGEEGTDEELAQGILFDKVGQTIDGLSRRVVAPAGVMLCYFKPEDKAKVGESLPEVKLGWAELRPIQLSTPIEDIPQDEKYPHVIDITEEGLRIIDRLREAQGYVTLQEQRDHNRQGWDDMWEQGNSDQSG